MRTVETDYRGEQARARANVKGGKRGRASDASCPARHSPRPIRSSSNRFAHLVPGVRGLFVVSPGIFERSPRMPLADVAAMDAIEGRVTRLPEARL